MDLTELQLNHPQTGELCDCKVWVTSRHPSQDGASITWRAEVRIEGKPKLDIGPRSSDLMAGALLLPPDLLARSLLERALA